MEYTRLNKAIAETGYCSRREADKLIEKRKVRVNGKLAEMGVKVTREDEISVMGEVLTKTARNIYLIFNKPIGITCTTDLRIKGNIISYINYPERIFPIGRLDKPSDGLIFMTNDGDIVNKILRSRNNHEKEYIVTVNKKISSDFIKKMSNGVPILDTVTKKCRVTRVNNYTFKIILTQGLNRQIRRMCEFLGYEVTSLRRLRIMNISLGNLKPGKYRSFTKKELKDLLALCEDSLKTHDSF
ncbi:pseudouridine synthase [Marinifilum sp. RC60d5]|uniref:pseudouridine synthase n=1 Tax=Marinifilum sp. RC60d5 TaxID=3458414 RepID=UPI004035E0E1